jgi:hypothetical protein
MTKPTGFVIQLLFDQRMDGRFHVHSPDVPGLHLAGPNLDEIRPDIEPVLKDILFHNSDVVVDKIDWYPSLEDVVKQMTSSAPPAEAKQGLTNFLVIFGHAA